MDPAVIHHDDVVASERRNQAVFDIGEEHLSGHGTFDHHRGDHFIVTQSGHEGDPIFQAERRSPGRHAGLAPLSLTMFVLTAVSSINTSRAGSSIPCSRIQRRRARATSARCRSAACSTFFERDVVGRKTPERAAAGFDPSALRSSEPFLPRSGPAVGRSRSKISTANSSNGETLPPRGFGAALLC